MSNIALSPSIQRVLDEETWDARGTVLRIDRMNLMRVTSIIGFLEHKFEIPASDWVTLRSMGYPNIHATPLMRALYAQLPIATDEAVKKACVLAERTDSRKIALQAPTTTPKAKAGMSLADLNGANKRGLRQEKVEPSTEEIDALAEAAEDLPSGREVNHPRVGHINTATWYNTATVAAILGISQSRVVQLIKKGHFGPNCEQDERTAEWSIPQAGFAQYIADRHEQAKSQLPEGWVDVARAARMLSCSHSKISGLLESGQLNGEKEDRAGREVWRISERSIEDYRLRQKGVGPDQVREIVSELVQQEGNRLEQALTSMLTAQHLNVMHALQVNLEIEMPGVAKKKEKADGGE